MAKTWYYYSAAVALLFLHCAAAPTVHFIFDAAARAVHSVGEAERWGAPLHPNLYSDWASSQVFHPNDVLSFKSSEGTLENVLEVTENAYDTCSKVNDLGNVIENVPTNYTLKKTGLHYFISTVGDQCDLGQKLAVNVVPDSSTPSTPSSAAPPALAAGSFLITLSFVLGKLVL